jgi:hypothetical protein
MRFDLGFQEQSDFLRAKLDLPTERWDDIETAAHDRAFIVAGAQKADLLADLHAEVVRAIESGEGLESFRKRFFKIVEANGWTGWTGEGTKGGRAWRSRVIYETNLLTSYSAGRLRQLKEGGFTHFLYKHSELSAKPRPEHLAWDGLVLEAGHAFWQTHYPPNGWGCRCRVVGVMSPEEARDLGGRPDKRLPMGWDEPVGPGGEPAGIDKGWSYQPGGNTDTSLREMVEAKLIKYPPAIAEALRADLERGAPPKG